jgi:TNF receptor-associated protein 1
MGAIRHFVKTNIIQRDKAQSLLSMIDLSLEINPRNGLIKSLYALHKKDPELAKLLAEQLLDNALIVAGLVEDPRLVLSNLNKLLEKVFAQKLNVN